MPPAQFLTLGDCRFYPKQQKLLSASNQDLKLRPQSLAVLGFLASQPNEIIAKDAIFQAVWSDVEVTDDSLVQCIGDIRRVLGDDKREILETIPRRGYVLRAGKIGSTTPGLIPGKQDKIEEQHHFRLAELIKRPEFHILLVGLFVLLLTFILIPRPQSDTAIASQSDAMVPVAQNTEPAIAIQPFKNLTDNRRWGRLAEALSSDIANELARNQWLFVTAPKVQPENTSSSNQLTSARGKPNSQYVLSGSVQAENDDLRISVRLSDATTGKIIWSERWDRPAQAIFAIQDDILGKVEATISGAWSGVVAKEGRVQAHHKSTSSLDAYELFLLGTEHKHKFTLEHDEIAASYFKKAAEIDPGYSKAWATLAVLRANQSVNALEKEKRSYFAQDRQSAAVKAYAANPTDPDALIQISWLEGKERDFKAAENSLRQAVDFSPNNPDILAHAAWVGAIRSPALMHDALAWGRKAVGLSAVYPAWYRAGLGIAAFYAADYQLSLTQLKHAPDMADVLIHRAAAAALLGDTEESSDAVKRFNAVVPAGFTVLEYIELNGFHQSSRSRLLKGARLAGLPIGDK